MRKNARLLGWVWPSPSGGRGRADVWDIQTENDNTIATENELVHGSDQLHDLGAIGGPADQDWYRISQKPFSSYEIVADSTSGDIAGLSLDRTERQTGRPSAVLAGRRRRLHPQPAVGQQHRRRDRRRADPRDERGCTTDCGPDDVYRIRVPRRRRTEVPRFNNSGTQITVLLLQNPTNYTINATVYFWNTAGIADRARSRSSLEPKALTVFNTATVAPGVGGA